VFEDILFAVLARVSEAIEEDLVARYAPLKSQQQEHEHQYQQQPGSDIVEVMLVFMLNNSMNNQYQYQQHQQHQQNQQHQHQQSKPPMK
jgi:uncharacterized protein YgiB involved in biofilm formation